MGLAVTRLDGLVSASAGYAAVGELLTQPINLTDTPAGINFINNRAPAPNTTLPIEWWHLQLNVDCGGHGALYVELLSVPADGTNASSSGGGTPLPCYSLAESSPIFSNDLRATPIWARSGDQSSDECAAAREGRMQPSGGLVQVRFVIEDCDLYSMQFIH
jgi:hypothetical protein